MKNYWLDKKNSILKSISTKGCDLHEIDFEFINGHIFTCSVKDGRLRTKMCGEKKKEMLEIIETEFQIAEGLAKKMFQGKLRSG